MPKAKNEHYRHSVIAGVSRMRSRIIEMHPLSFAGQLFKRSDSLTNSSGVLTSESGLGVLSREDRPDYEFVDSGRCYVLSAEAYQNGLVTDDGGLSYAEGEEFPFLIEMAETEGEEEIPSIEQNDVILIYVNAGGVLSLFGYEIDRVTTPIGMGAFAKIYVAVRRGELDELRLEE